tara:strand:+ start:3094 stop:3645 length:552 start_codon:yes stop_codon:yes gene_type:complete
MLTDKQIEFAQSNSLHHSAVADAIGDTISDMYHTSRGVYVIVRDALTGRIYNEHSFHISYRMLGTLNYITWPNTFVGGQRLMIEDQGEYWVVKGKRGKYEVEKKGSIPFASPFEMESPKRLRDDDGYPVKGTQWLYQTTQHLYSIVRPIKDKEKVRMIHSGTQHATSMRLEFFNENFYPVSLS